VEAVLDDFSIELAAMSAPAGSVSFNIANGGDLTHDFIVLTTDLDPGNLPQDATARVEIDGDTVTRVDGVEQIPTNEADTLTAELPQGDYVIICNVAGHYEQGMYTTFTAE